MTDPTSKPNKAIKRSAHLSLADIAYNGLVEAMPPLDHAVHRFLLTHHGVTHLENLYLEQLSRDQVYECLLIVTPLRLQGATGSWVHPIAIA